MNEPYLVPIRRGGLSVAWFGDDHHRRDGGEGELKPLTGFESRRANDLDLHQRLVPIAHAVDGFAAEEHPFPQFTGYEFRVWRDGDLRCWGGQHCGSRSRKSDPSSARSLLYHAACSGSLGGAHR